MFRACADGQRIPPGEHLAGFIFDQAQARLGSPAHVAKLAIAEDETVSASYSE